MKTIKTKKVDVTLIVNDPYETCECSELFNLTKTQVENMIRNDKSLKLSDEFKVTDYMMSKIPSKVESYVGEYKEYTHEDLYEDHIKRCLFQLDMNTKKYKPIYNTDGSYRNEFIGNVDKYDKYIMVNKLYNKVVPSFN
tara:strand:- start:2640 stop:3056 length:417 start_codon:yes stop_codon:yes gene_type:complete